MKVSTLMIAAAILASAAASSAVAAPGAGSAPLASRPGNICTLATLGLPVPCRPH